MAGSRGLLLLIAVDVFLFAGRRGGASWADMLLSPRPRCRIVVGREELKKIDCN